MHAENGTSPATLKCWISGLTWNLTQPKFGIVHVSGSSAGTPGGRSTWPARPPEREAAHAAAVVVVAAAAALGLGRRARAAAAAAARRALPRARVHLDARALIAKRWNSYESSGEPLTNAGGSQPTLMLVGVVCITYGVPGRVGTSAVVCSVASGLIGP